MNFGNFLLIDASSPLFVIVGKLSEDGRSWTDFFEEKSPALEGVFSAIGKKSESAESVHGFLFCEGPGSILGIRIAAAAIRAKLALDRAAGVPALPVFAFGSLRLAAMLLMRAQPTLKNFIVAAESRLNSCNILRVSDGVPAENFEEIKFAEAGNFAAEKIFVLPARRALPEPFSLAEICSVAELLKNDPAVFADNTGLAHDCGALPDALNSAPADSYARWSPSRARAKPSGNVPAN